MAKSFEVCRPSRPRSDSTQSLFVVGLAIQAKENPGNGLTAAVQAALVEVLLDRVDAHLEPPRDFLVGEPVALQVERFGSNSRRLQVDNFACLNCVRQRTDGVGRAAYLSRFSGLLAALKQASRKGGRPIQPTRRYRS